VNQRSIPARLRPWLQTLGDRCEYCGVSEQVTGIPLEADHIIPLSQQGVTEQVNLCRACSQCNTYKADQTEGVDPESMTRAPLYNPRQQSWAEHFAWSENGTQIIGLTAIGRATVAALKMNNPVSIRARKLWVSVGWHPPSR